MSSVTIASGPLRAQVIGAGPACLSMHLPVLARLRDQGRIVLQSVCDIVPERAAAARRRFGFLEDCGSPMLTDPISMSYIFATARWHYEYGLNALRKGKHLCRKAHRTDFRSGMRDGRGRQGAFLHQAVGGHNRRFHPALMALRGPQEKAG